MQHHHLPALSPPSPRITSHVHQNNKDKPSLPPGGIPGAGQNHADDQNHAEDEELLMGGPVGSGVNQAEGSGGGVNTRANSSRKTSAAQQGGLGSRPPTTGGGSGRGLGNAPREPY